MTGNDHMDSRGFGLEIQLPEIVHDVDGNAAEFDKFRLGQVLAPGRLIDVATDGSQWRHSFQVLQNCGIADISGVNNVVGAAESVQCFRPKQSVSVGDDADEDGSSQFSDVGFWFLFIK